MDNVEIVLNTCVTLQLFYSLVVYTLRLRMPTTTLNFLFSVTNRGQAIFLCMSHRVFKNESIHKLLGFARLWIEAVDVGFAHPREQHGYVFYCAFYYIVLSKMSHRATKNHHESLRKKTCNLRK